MNALTHWKDVISALVLIVVSIAMFFASNGLEAKTRMDIGPDFMPKLVAVLTLALSVVLLVQGLRRNRALRAAGKLPGQAGVPRQGDFLERHADWLSLLLIVAYTFAFEPLGYLVATACYLFLQFTVMAKADERRYLPFAVVAVAVSALSYYVFLRLFYVFLPVGLLG
ncbi:MAG: tripartite tricarboxylate transporter TctB family protein [Rhizobiaceae bacterium]|nr:tripartite tricarboxylate transporter TctB family protein [Rhizobiaceae bacterium]